MIKLSLDKAIEILEISNIGLFADLLSDIKLNELYANTTAYQINKNIVLKTLNWDLSKCVYYVCDTGNSSMDLTLESLKKVNNDNLDIIAIHSKELCGEYCLMFSRIGEVLNNDGNIRKLNDKDLFLIENLTLTDVADDIFTKSIANSIKQNFIDMNKENITILGIFFEGNLAGAVSIKNNINLIAIKNIFVAKDYRGKKLANNLLKSALSLYPKVRYSYSCGSDNLSSIATAKSVGFNLEGTYDFI